MRWNFVCKAPQSVCSNIELFAVANIMCSISTSWIEWVLQIQVNQSVASVHLFLFLFYSFMSFKKGVWGCCLQSLYQSTAVRALQAWWLNEIHKVKKGIFSHVGLNIAIVLHNTWSSLSAVATFMRKFIVESLLVQPIFGANMLIIHPDTRNLQLFCRAITESGCRRPCHKDNVNCHAGPMKL